MRARTVSTIYARLDATVLFRRGIENRGRKERWSEVKLAPLLPCLHALQTKGYGEPVEVTPRDYAEVFGGGEGEEPPR